MPGLCDGVSRSPQSLASLSTGLQDTEVFYDLKKLLEESGASVPSQLASHEAARTKPGGIDSRPRRDQVVYAKN